MVVQNVLLSKIPLCVKCHCGIHKPHCNMSRFSDITFTRWLLQLIMARITVYATKCSRVVHRFVVLHA